MILWWQLVLAVKQSNPKIYLLAFLNTAFLARSQWSSSGSNLAGTSSVFLQRFITEENKPTGLLCDSVVKLSSYLVHLKLLQILLGWHWGVHTFQFSNQRYLKDSGWNICFWENVVMPHKVRILTEQTQSFSEEPQTAPTEKDEPPLKRHSSYFIVFHP